MVRTTTIQPLANRTTKFLFIGAGLSNLVIAWRLLKSSRSVQVSFIDDGLSPPRRWSFHQSDVSSHIFNWANELVDVSWDRSIVRTKSATIELPQTYCSIYSKNLLNRLKNDPRVIWEKPTRITRVDPTTATDEEGTIYTADIVIDGRGGSTLDDLGGYQKFLGIEYQTAQPHGIQHPTLMDFCVSQEDGFRFVYTLPLSEDRVLIEDTYYSDTPDLDLSRLEQRIEEYARQKGWPLRTKLNTEAGALKIPFYGSMPPQNATISAGLRAGLFHMTTGYSSACAFSFAEWMISTFENQGHIDFAAVENYRHDHWNRQGFFRRLNSIWFKALPPERRVDVMQHFFDRHLTLIPTFFRGELTLWNKLRLLAIYPNVPLIPSVQLFFVKSKMRTTT